MQENAVVDGSSKPYALSISEASELLRSKQLSPVELVTSVLGRIDSVEPAIEAFAAVWAEEAVAEAKIAEGEISRGEYRGALHGVPIGIKDIIDIEGQPTRAGSAARDDHIARETATLVSSLRAAGAIVVGKTTTHEIALGVMTPPTKNPWNTQYAPGGSSGGSAAAVASGEILAGIGTDTGGSIRGPAALCGVVGLKPTFGRVSKFGVLTNTWSLDTPGPIARTVRDAAIVLSATAGWDERDNTTFPVNVPRYEAALTGDIQGVRVAIPTNYYFEHVDRGVEQAVRAAAVLLEENGAHITEVTLPLAETYHPVMYAVVLPEIGSYHEDSLRTRAMSYGSDVRHALLAGTLMRAGDYLRAQRVREMIRVAWLELYERIDLIVGPTHPAGAPKPDQSVVVWEDGSEEGVLSVYSRLTCPANLTGFPAVSVPCGRNDLGLPYGLQIIGRPFEEETVLKVADVFERCSGWTRLLCEGPLRSEFV